VKERWQAKPGFGMIGFGMKGRDKLLFASIVAGMRIAAGCFLFVEDYEERGGGFYLHFTATRCFFICNKLQRVRKAVL